MSLQRFVDNGWIQKHSTNKKEISGLFDIVERDKNDFKLVELSSDRRFGIAYNAALKLCTILLHAEGYRPATGSSHHMRTIAMLPEILGAKHKHNKDYLDACRRKRNKAEYDLAGTSSGSDAEELMKFAAELETEVVKWLQQNHSELI